MKIDHKVPVIISCKAMHEHRQDAMHLTFDVNAPLECTLELRDRAPYDDPYGWHPDIVWRLPRVDVADALTYDAPGVTSTAGVATLKIMTSKPSIMVVKLPYVDAQGKSDQYFMLKVSKLRLFMNDVNRCVPQSCEDVALGIDRLIGRLLYR